MGKNYIREEWVMHVETCGLRAVSCEPKPNGLLVTCAEPSAFCHIPTARRAIQQLWRIRRFEERELLGIYAPRHRWPWTDQLTGCACLASIHPALLPPFLTAKLAFLKSHQGNSAYLQTQLDIYGALLDAIYLFNKCARPISSQLWQGLRCSYAWGMHPL